MRTSRGSGAPPLADEEATQARHLRTLVQLQQWPEAKAAALELAHRHPHKAEYRAQLALARGHEAWQAGDAKRAREEWNRAVILDPTLEAALVAVRGRARRPSLISRLFRRG
jgi:hypothetical protein